MAILVSKDERNNVIYHYKPLDEILKNSTIKFTGENNIVFLDAKTTLNHSNFNLSQNNALIFIAASFLQKVGIFTNNNNVCYIGNSNYFNPAGGHSLSLSEEKNIFIGNSCLFSFNIWFRTADPHLVYDKKTNQRLNPSKSIYIGDHCWIGQESAFLKGAFMTSGSILGAKSITSKLMYSNAVYAGNPSKKVKDEIFWSGECVHAWTKEQSRQYNNMQKEDFKYNFEKQSFLNPALIEKELESMDTALQKLEFVYDYIYNNTEKNRFALFEDSDISECKLYKDENKRAFKDLDFKDAKEKVYIHKTLKDLEQKRKAYLESLKPSTAALRIKNTLSYKLGQAMIRHSKSSKNYIKLLFILNSINKEHKAKLKAYEASIKTNPSLKLPPLETYKDYDEALKIKEHLSYRLGFAFIQACKTWYKGTLIDFIFKARRLVKEFKLSK